MTKMKSKKMTKSTFAIIIMGIIMVAMLAFGGTFAYFTYATHDAVQGNLVAGRIVLKTDDKLELTATTNLLPGEDIFTATLGDDTKFTVVDESNRESYVFFVFSATVQKATPETRFTNTPAYTEAAVAIEGAGLDSYEDITVTGIEGFALSTSNAGKLTNGAVWVKIAKDQAGKLTFELPVASLEVPEDWDNEYQQAKITVSFEIKAAQGTFNSAQDAWDNAFTA